MAAFNDKTPPAFNRQSDDYSKWKKKFNIWKGITDLDKRKQGGNLILRLDDTTQEQVLELVTEAEIATEEGADKIIQKLDVLFKTDKKLLDYKEYEDFESYRRPREMSITEYLNEFEKRWNKTKSNGTALSENVLAYRLLRSANLTRHDEQLVIATIGEFNFNNMKEQLQKVVTGIGNRSNLDFTNISIKEEPTESETLYGNTFRGNRGNRGRGRFFNDRRNFGSRDTYQQNKFQKDHFKPDNQYTEKKDPKKKKGRNPLDQWGNVTRCVECDSVNHWVKNCPDVKNRRMYRTYEEECEKQPQNENEVIYESDTLFEIGLFHSDYDHPRRLKNLVGEAMSAAVLDCGAEQTVCGVKWLNCYIESLNSEDRSRVNTLEQNYKHVFKFGDGRKIPAIKRITIPSIIGNKSINIVTDVIDEDIPLLFSKTSLKKARSQIDFINDKINILGQEVTLGISESGHYLLPLGRHKQVLIEADRKENSKITLHASASKLDPQETASKLHRQFAHPAPDKLVKLVQGQENSKDLVEAIKRVSDTCKICKEFRKPPPRPVVGFPMATRFGECVAMDLKQFGNVYLLHLIDHATRFSSGAVIRTKQADVIIREIFKCWISVFGCAEKFLVDNGGEFNNEKFREMCETLNITIKTTAAESPWSNGLVERHNQIMGEMVTKIMADMNCSLEFAVMWSLNAHNSLSNVHGYSPYQLVLGRNPTIPTLQNDLPPALCSENTSDMLRKNLQALHNAREAFIQSENSERIRRALRHNIRTSGEVKYITGDVVYYKRLDSKKWKGPAVVIGQDSQQVLVKHGGELRRVPPCRLTLVKDTVVGAKLTAETSKGDKQISNSQSTYKGVIENTDLRVEISEENSEVGEQNPSENSENDPADENDRIPFIGQEEGLIPNPENRELESESGTIETENGEHNLSNEPLESRDELNSTDKEYENEQQTKDLTSSPENINSLSKTAKESTGNIEEYSEKRGRPKKKPKVYKATDKLTRGMVVRFKPYKTKRWETTKLSSRSGKCGGKYSGEWNTITKDNEKQVIDFDRDVSEWKTVGYHLPEHEELIVSSVYLQRMDTEGHTAKLKELQSWKDNNVYTEVEDQNQSCVSIKWVMKPKIINGVNSMKARLVLRGYEEEVDFRTDSPTCMIESVRVLMALAATKGWEIHSADFKTAFLQGDVISRDVFIRPPKEACTNKLWRLNKTVYGLNDASRSWYLKLRETILTLGCQPSLLDNGLFYLHMNGNLCGILASFVDDILHAGDENFKEVIIRLKAEFVISHEQKAIFKYIGINILQRPDLSIKIEQNSYVQNIEYIPMTNARQKMKNDNLTEAECKMLRSRIGQIRWLCRVSRPDIGYYACIASTTFKTATVQNLIDMNKLIKHIKSTPSCIEVPNFENLESLKLVVFTDASYANLTDGGSQGAHVVFLSDGRNCCPIVWHSRRIKRVVHNVLAAETLSLIEGCESAIMFSNLIAEVITGDRKSKLPIICLTDNKNLCQTSHTTHTLKEKRLLVEIAIVREMVSKNEIQLKWISSDEQLSDALTKKGASGAYLREVMEAGRL